MPYDIRRSGSNYVVVDDKGKVVGTHPTRRQAINQQRALYANVPDAAEKKAPCWDGFVQRGMKEKDGKMVPNCVPATTKASEGYTPNAGMKAAARRALKWKEDGKATGAGTAVGWGRATDIVAGRSLSLDTVKRMYSFFSRHEVDKKGKDFYNTSNPSNGRIMWDAWGGDAGYSWSRNIVEREKAKKVWQNSPFNLG